MAKRIYDEKHLSVHKPEATSVFHATACNKDTCNIFYENFVKIVEKHFFTANEICDADKTSVPNVHAPVKEDKRVKKKVEGK